MTAYRSWHECARHFPKTSRYTLGAKIDYLFLNCIERTFAAAWATAINEKITELKRAAVALDMAKFFLQIAWETGFIEMRRYATLSENLNEIGRMLGGWRKGLEKKLSPGT